ncbi:MAG: hypothetical protein AAF215_05135 [Cyanobacteria bacterium P01_A01_bin.123]
MDFKPQDPIKYLEGGKWIDAIVMAYAAPLLKVGVEVKCQGNERYQVVSINLAYPEQWRLIGPPF